MRSKYTYSIIINLEEICEITASRAYQIHWLIGHLSTGNTFLDFVAPIFEHNFVVVKFPYEEDGKDDVYFTNQFKKVEGEWVIVEYGGVRCKFCEDPFCNRVYYKVALEELLGEVTIMDWKPSEKRYAIYKRFTAIK